jgi:DNA-binding NtrC family response regulator
MAQDQVAKSTFIMIVDDDEDIMRVFSTSLKKAGYNVHSFLDPMMAYEHFRYSPDDCSLVISDVRMPGMSGFQLARKIKELKPKVKVVLTSAFEINMNEFRTLLPHAKVDGFLEKPISLEMLQELVKGLSKD